MHSTAPIVRALRLLLVLAFGCLLLAQTLGLPSMVRHLAEDSPDLAHLRYPVLVVSVLGVLCVQVVIVCTWRLLTMVEHDRIFSEDSMRWVDAIVWAIGAAWTLLLGVFVTLLVNAGLTGLPAALLLMVVAGAVLGLLMIVMRALLRQATTLRTDMEAVI